MTDTIFSLSAKTKTGAELALGQFEGKVLLVVNTASQCGFTPQYTALQKLHEQFASKGLVVLGFPCDQFGHQEPGTNDEIEEFCKVNFGVSFPILAKSDVNGPQTNPIFAFLKKRKASLFGTDIKWNFTKFLVAKDGKTVKRFEPTSTPESMVRDIEKFLN